MQIELDQQALKEVQSALRGLSRRVPWVQSAALNKTMIGVRTDKSKAIRSHLNLKKAYVDKHITIKKSSPSNVSGSTNTKAKRPGLMTFTGTRSLANNKGVSVKVLADGPRVVLRHAFIAEAKGTTQVFQRDYQGKGAIFRPGFGYSRLPKTHRFPIYRLAGPSLAEYIGHPGVIAQIVILAGERLIANANNLVSYELSKM